MDSSGFFHDLAPGANNDVSGIVTLLGAAYALGQLKRDIVSYFYNSDLLYMYFIFRPIFSIFIMVTQKIHWR